MWKLQQPPLIRGGYVPDVQWSPETTNSTGPYIYCFFLYVCVYTYDNF